MRDTRSGTTVLVGPGAGGFCNTANLEYTAISADSRCVASRSTSQLVPEDANNFPDLYLRDIETATTTLVSRASSPSGAIANSYQTNVFVSLVPSISADGRFVAFESTATNLDPEQTNDRRRQVYVRETPRTRHLAGVARLANVRPPDGGDPFLHLPGPRLRRLRPPQPRSTPRRSPSTPAAQRPRTRPRLTVGTPDANGRAAKLSARSRRRQLPGNPGTPADEADVRPHASITDVRHDLGLADYTGELEARIPLTITDRLSSPYPEGRQGATTQHSTCRSRSRAPPPPTRRSGRSATSPPPRTRCSRAR